MKYMLTLYLVCLALRETFEAIRCALMSPC